jgi:hypothetical protein
LRISRIYPAERGLGAHVIVLALRRGAEISFEVWDEVTKSGFDVPFPEVLTVAEDINLDLARIFDEL